ncbi:MAG: hypothetical protein IPP52_11575 [Ignavibacteria bacterium]|nr:hypothetical protein [Ignavibacteria bacterium]
MGNTGVSNSYDIDALNNNPANILKQRTNNNSSAYFSIFLQTSTFTLTANIFPTTSMINISQVIQKLIQYFCLIQTRNTL